jgi:hypothetical protein
MRKFVIPAALVALLATASVACAADATGTVKAVDASAGTVTLDNNAQYLLPASIKATDVKVGAKVKVTYTVVAGMNMISQLANQ